MRLYLCFFFFSSRRRHTRLTCDWSSDVALPISSGATLALKAAASGLPITHLVLYEPPFNTDDNYPALPAGFAGELAELVSAGRRGDAVELYQTQAAGIPQEVVAHMRHAPFRPGLEAIAHTLAYDAAI